MDMILLEAKLKSKERNKLKDSDFGLPKERKFPLNDEAHVRKAIQFFKYCKPTRRAELAMNINKKVKQFNMKVTVSKRNPFTKYVNKNSELNITITENQYMDDYVEESIRDNMQFITQYPISSIEDMVTLEQHCKLLIDEALEQTLISSHDSHIIESINSYLKSEYDDFDEFSGYSSTMYRLVENAMNELISSIDDINVYQEKYPTLINIIESTQNKFHAYRACCQVMSELTMRANECDDLIASAINKFARNIRQVKDTLKCEHCANKPNSVVESVSIHDFPNMWLNTESVTITLEDTHNQINNDLYIINKELNDIIGPLDEYPKLVDLPIYEDKVKIINHVLTLNLDSDDSLFVSRYITSSNGRIIDKLYTDDFTGTKLTFGYSTRTNTHYLIAKVMDTEVYNMVLIKLTEDTLSFLCGYSKYYEIPPIRVIQISEKTASFNIQLPGNNVLSEAFAVNEDGDIKITISPKNSYMDSYSANHKMMVQNYKNGNYEAMKKNLAYVFALIATIERSDEYKNRDPEVMKARMFAINDFNTYLKHLQSVEPDFDFVEYYMSSDFDKKIINIPKSTIIGVKKLMRAILL